MITCDGCGKDLTPTGCDEQDGLTWCPECHKVVVLPAMAPRLGTGVLEDPQEP